MNLVKNVQKKLNNYNYYLSDFIFLNYINLYFIFQIKMINKTIQFLFRYIYYNYIFFILYNKINTNYCINPTLR